LQQLLISAAAEECKMQGYIKIKTSSGILDGCRENGNIDVFRGVPYAQPPVGDNRFRRAIELVTPDEERDCTCFRPACVQEQFGNAVAFPTSEDCLYLNIWAPAENKSGLPVMFWIFGGGFNNGSAADPDFDGRNMAARGVVLVTVSYRIGVLGFLAHPSLSADDADGLSGNYGLTDQILALQWVKKNITAFGGNPDNITIFGQSAGGISCRMHLVSPLSRGLFRHAIIESGGGLNEADPVRPVGEYMEIVREIMKRLGWSEDVLKTASPEQLNHEMQRMSREVLGPKELFFFQPVIDDYVLLDVPGNSIAKGEYDRNADIICGTVLGDSWMFSRKVREQIGDDPARAKGFAMSPFASFAKNNVMRGFPAIHTYFMDRVIPDPLDPASLGPFPHNGKGPGGNNTTPHGSEIQYVFGTYAEKPRKWEEYDTRLSEAMMSYWVNFAAKGDPNGEGTENWTPYTDSSPKTMQFGNNGWNMRTLPDTEEGKKIAEYTVRHPGMLEKWEDN
jgi:para-nitrobenzyl esterase